MYHNVLGKCPLPGKHPCTKFQGVKIAGFIQIYGYYIPDKCPYGPNHELCLSAHGCLLRTLRYTAVTPHTTDNNPDGKSDSAAAPSSFSEQLSSLGSDSTSSQSTGTDSGVYQR